MHIYMYIEILFSPNIYEILSILFYDSQAPDVIIFFL